MGQVVTYTQGPHDLRTHECATRAAVARVLADLLGYAFAGEYDASVRYDGPLYFVPSDTLVGCAQAAALGIRGTADLFGAVVAHPYVSTKSITHGVVDADAVTPAGWTPYFAQAVDACVLRGFSAFHHDDAHRAGRALLAHSPVRIKRATGIGGGGQFVVDSADALADVLATLEPDELAAWGVVL